MTPGTVKWFHDQQGCGVIAQGSGPAVFVHDSAIDASGFKSLHEGDAVEFTVTQGPKGPQAQAVKKGTTTTARSSGIPPRRFPRDGPGRDISRARHKSLRQEA
jgi:cold shock protein